MSSPTHAKPERDWGYLTIRILIVAIAIWLLLMPVVPAIAQATMLRFHLRTGSWLTWAIQFPIPPMYNFANRVKVDDIPPSMAGLVSFGLPQTTSSWRYCNHFPTRRITFANTRFRHLRSGKDRWYTIESVYREHKLVSRVHIKLNEKQVMAWIDESDDPFNEESESEANRILGGPLFPSMK